MSRKILIVDDEADICDLISAYIEKEGYQVYKASDGESAIRSARAYKPDFIILDIMLPGMNGLEVLSAIRRESNAYVFLLTAKTEEVDKIVGLNMGADDYITKPFSPRELVAKVNATFRRMSLLNTDAEKRVLQFANIRLDENAHQVWVKEEAITLTAVEFDLLAVLMTHPGHTLSREKLLEKVWGGDYFGDTRVVDVHIGHIRKKIGPELITTIWGVGYRFMDKPLI